MKKAMFGKLEACISWGHGGQFILINKNKNIIVVITSERHPSGDHSLSVNTALSIYDRINNAIIE
jgi:CubicO group peptidase (beta-lactamase class C family)